MEPAFDLNMEPPAFDIGFDLNLPLDDGAINWNLPLDEHGAINFEAPLYGGFNLNFEQHDNDEEAVEMDAAAQGGFDLNIEQHDNDEEALEMDAAAQGAGRRKDCPDEVRQLVFQTLLARSKNGRLGKKVTGEVAAQFGLGIQTVQKIWKKAKVSLDEGIVADVKSRKRGRSGRKKVPIDLEPLRNIPLNERITLDDVSRRLHVGKAKLIRYMRKGLLRRHSNTIKPYLTEANKKTRLQFCVNMIDEGSTPNEPHFKDLFDHVFIDEKWFFLTQNSARYYLLLDEDDPHRSSKSKNYIPRLMFLCVTARPRFVNGVCVFDGKIGCFPLVTWEQAKRSSVNQQAGTWEVKPIAHITREVIREFMIERVLPAIKAKWPREDIAKPIYIVQDNAPSHIEVNDALFCEHAKKDGFDIRLLCQPPNAPDFNILDLGFFHSIQSIQYKTAAKTVQELVPIVQEAFNVYCPMKANRIWLTLDLVMKEAMKVGGTNKYKIPDINKKGLEIRGQLPLQIACEASIVEEAKTLLAAANN